MTERMTSAPTEKDMYVQALESEFEITQRVLKAYPPEKCELKPAEKMKNARELGWMLVLNQLVVPLAIEGNLKPENFPPAPKTWNEVLTRFESAHRDTVARLKQVSDRDFNRTIKLPTGRNQISDVRVADALWMFLRDTTHHRGQFSVFLRIAGGRLPSIYGPTADEPWSDQPSAH